jgi:hypothetical protein
MLPVPLPPGSGPGVDIGCRVYRPCDPRKTPLFQLLESLYEAVKVAWEERFELARLAWQSVRELMAAAVEEPDLRPGMVSVIQTFGDRVNPHPMSARWSPGAAGPATTASSPSPTSIHTPLRASSLTRSWPSSSARS